MTIKSLLVCLGLLGCAHGTTHAMHIMVPLVRLASNASLMASLYSTLMVKTSSSDKHRFFKALQLKRSQKARIANDIDSIRPHIPLLFAVGTVGSIAMGGIVPTLFNAVLVTVAYGGLRIGLAPENTSYIGKAADWVEDEWKKL